MKTLEVQEYPQNLTRLELLGIHRTGLCAPPDSDFPAWLERIDQTSGLMGVAVCQ